MVIAARIMILMAPGLVVALVAVLTRAGRGSGGFPPEFWMC